MNWLGLEIQKEIGSEDTVLDFGCGIMQTTTPILDTPRTITRNFLRYRTFQRKLKCRSYLGVELNPEYVKRCKYFDAIVGGLEYLKYSHPFDVVICLDVLEHLNFVQAHNAIIDMKRIARKKVIIYTPKEFHTNEENINAWNIGHNELQLHRSLISPKYLESIGFTVTSPKETLAYWLKNNGVST